MKIRKIKKELRFILEACNLKPEARAERGMAVKKCIGLDIGSKNIKLIELVKQKNKISLSRIAKFNAGIKGLQQVVNFIETNKMKSSYSVLAVQGQSVFIRFVKLLPISADKINQTIRYEAQQQIPFSLDEVAWDYHLIHSNKETSLVSTKTKQAQKFQLQPIEAILVAVKKSIIKEAMDEISSLKLKFKILDAAPFAIHNCLVFNKIYHKDKILLLVNVGARATDLIIYNKGQIWIRSFPIAGDKINEALKQRFNISLEEAEKLKITNGIAVSYNEFVDTVKPIINDLITEIERSIDYYYFQMGDTAEKLKNLTLNQGETKVHIDEIILSGGTVSLEGMIELFERRLNTKVTKLNPFKNILTSERLSENTWQFGTAAGLALRGLIDNDLQINLLKEEILSKKEARQKKWFSLLSIIIGMTIIIIGGWFVKDGYHLKQKSLEILDKKIAAYKIYTPKIKNLDAEITILKRKVNALYNLGRQRSLWLDTLKELKSLLPKGVWITNLQASVAEKSLYIDNENSNKKKVKRAKKHSGKKLKKSKEIRQKEKTETSKFSGNLVITGFSISYADINKFMANLKSSVFFDKVSPLSSSFKKDKGKEELVEFSVKMEVL